MTGSTRWNAADMLWGGVLNASVQRVADGQGDELIVLPRNAEGNAWRDELMVAAQHDDDVSALAAIDVLRILVAQYETEQEGAPDEVAALAGDELIAQCPDHPHAGRIAVETGYTRYWSVVVGEIGQVVAFDDKIDWESGAGDDHFECATCLRRLDHRVDFNQVDFT